MNNLGHKFTLQEFLDKVEERAKEGYTKKTDLVELFTQMKQAWRDWEEYQWDTYARMESLSLYKPQNNCPICLQWVLY